MSDEKGAGYITDASLRYVELWNKSIFPPQHKITKENKQCTLIKTSVSCIIPAVQNAIQANHRVMQRLK